MAQPEFYLTLNGILVVHRTSDGVVTDSATVPDRSPTESVTADASDRAFYFANSPGCSTAPPVAQFYRVTINDSGRFTGTHAVGSPIGGMIASFAISPDGSRMAYTLEPATLCGGAQRLVAAIHVMDLSTGAIRTWQDNVTNPDPGRVGQLAGLSWTPDGRTVIAMTRWGRIPVDMNDISVLGLDTSGDGGSLRAASRMLLSQDQSCVTCVQDAIAGPDGGHVPAARPAAAPNGSPHLAGNGTLAVRAVQRHHAVRRRGGFPRRVR